MLKEVRPLLSALSLLLSPLWPPPPPLLYIFMFSDIVLIPLLHLFSLPLNTVKAFVSGLISDQHSFPCSRVKETAAASLGQRQLHVRETNVCACTHCLQKLIQMQASDKPSPVLAVPTTSASTFAGRWKKQSRLCYTLGKTLPWLNSKLSYPPPPPAAPSPPPQLQTELSPLMLRISRSNLTMSSLFKCGFSGVCQLAK
jgi:hypothetical protein